MLMVQCFQLVHFANIVREGDVILPSQYLHLIFDRMGYEDSRSPLNEQEIEVFDALVQKIKGARSGAANHSQWG